MNWMLMILTNYFSNFVNDNGTDCMFKQKLFGLSHIAHSGNSDLLPFPRQAASHPSQLRITQ